MDSLNAAILVNLLGFTVGIALYGLLALMVIKHRGSSTSRSVELLLMTTAVLGLVWNIGELIVMIQRDFESTKPFLFLSAAAYSALGFLPSVVVHSAQNEATRSRMPVGFAYAVSVFAAIMHFTAAIAGKPVPSAAALQMLTIGAVTLAGVLLILNFRQTLEKKAIWATALLVFAVSALHLSTNSAETSWFVELAAHQSSLPLALAILYQNFRFAFADLFLKRAISLLLIAVVAFALYVGVAAPLLRFHETHDRNDVFAISLILTLWIATALVYPLLHRLAVWLVDRVILRRIDFDELLAQVENEIESIESTPDVLDVVSSRLAKAMTAENYGWHESGEDRTGPADTVVIQVPTAEAPRFEIELARFTGGRRLLSDEMTLIGSIATSTARRIDSIRVMHERCDREFREQEYSKLATEAQLKALRSQVNPHFLFNALTTIGYLIESSPKKAVETLMHLTKLLRAVLKTTGEFSTLGEEIQLIEDYLDIERARFEERLTVKIDVPPDLKAISIPPLILQPLAENAIKHGISESKTGGQLTISAERYSYNDASFLKMTVRNTVGAKKLRDVSLSTGLGLQNIRDRLKAYFGAEATLSLDFGSDGWTTAEVNIPLAGGARAAA